MIPSRTIAGCLAACVLMTGTAMAQYAKTPPGPPGGLPGYSPPPMPSMPPAAAPSVTIPSPPPMAPDVRAPVIVVPPPPPPPDRSRDGGGSQECDCYRTVDGKRVFSGKSATCCPK